MASQGKRLSKAREMVEQEKQYTIQEAAKLLTEFPAAKFDESVDIAVKLGVDPKKAEENIRGTVSLPHGTGKTLRVVVFCRGEKIKEATDAGADFAGAEDLVQRVEKEGWLDFDAAIATPDVMAQVGRIGKILGPRGLMPNPKVGTVTFDVAKAVTAVKSGRVEFRVEKAGIVHMAVAKVSFGAQKIEENLVSVIDALVKAKPQTSKGVYLQAINVSTTMGPGITVNPATFRI
jgi:large subunit ribosomal protein L1